MYSLPFLVIIRQFREPLFRKMEIKMDRFEAMSAFVAVAEAGSFSAASRKLGTPLATLSRKVSELEEQLKVRLLSRSTRQLALTDSGQEYLTVCKRLLDELHDVERQLSGEYRAPKGELVVSAPIVFGRLYVMPIVVAFLRAYPDVQVDLRLADSVTNLLEDHIDVAVRIGDLPDSAIMAVRAGDIRHVVCASPAYIAAHGAPAHPSALVDHDCISCTALQAPHEWTFKHGNQIERYKVRARLVVTTAEAAADAAIAGAGVTRLLCYQVARAIGDGRLALLMRDQEPNPAPIHLVYPSGRLVPQKLRAFLDFALPRLKAALVFEA